MIDQPWGVSTSGQGTASVEPDHAVIGFAINRMADEPGRALAETRTSASAARAALRGHGVPDGGVTSSRTKVHSVWDGHGTTRRLAGHHCRVEFAVRVDALDVVEECLVDLVDAGADEILSVTYDSSRRPELWDAARRQAIEFAVAKAKVYAEAADLTLGPIVHIEDVDPIGHGIGLSRRAAMAGGEAAGDPLLPGSVVVDASVVVGFSIAR